MALDTSALDRVDLATRYLVANTPTFLFSSYRKLSYIRQFSQANSPDDLIQVIEDIDASARRSARDVSLAYAATIALTLHDPSVVRAWLRDADLQNLSWPIRMLTDWLNSLIAVTSLSVDLGRPSIVGPTVPAPQASSNTTLIWTPSQ